ncbi:ANR family transcriptional regulator [Actinobacillus sp. GY-402]|nr:ANR family transcriptional regulator [Actinobacillus sp. GY-402]
METYKELVLLAIKTERAGDYSYAQQLWERAVPLAKNPVKKMFCRKHAEFLDVWKNRLYKARREELQHA